MRVLDQHLLDIELRIARAALEHGRDTGRGNIPRPMPTRPTIPAASLVVEIIANSFCRLVCRFVARERGFPPRCLVYHEYAKPARPPTVPSLHPTPTAAVHVQLSYSRTSPDGGDDVIALERAPVDGDAIVLAARQIAEAAPHRHRHGHAFVAFRTVLLQALESGRAADQVAGALRWPNCRWRRT